VNEHDEKVAQLVRSGIAITCIDRGLSGIDADTVLVNNRRGAYEAVHHLLKLGHRRIAFISGMPEIPTSVERVKGYRDALEEHHIPFDPALIKYGDSKYESGLRFTKELLQGPQPPTALFTGNNLITLGALQMIHSMRLNIPKDIAIVGFDDMYWSLSLNPPLTAVKQSGYAIGRKGAELLLKRIRQPDRPAERVIFDTELKIRRSCGSM
jgi:LacI family transcriptional regulator/LacI family repressor for deo operon, udp, cdd, tsx, nupC, and nupG